MNKKNSKLSIAYMKNSPKKERNEQTPYREKAKETRKRLDGCK